MCSVCRKPAPNPSFRILSAKQYAAAGHDVLDYRKYLARRSLEIAGEKLRLIVR